MVFLHSQFLHPLLPQDQDFQANQELAEDISKTRQEYFGLLKQAIEALTLQNLTKAHQLRKQLDAIPAIQEANEQRSKLQDKMWSYNRCG